MISKKLIAIGSLTSLVLSGCAGLGGGSSVGGEPETIIIGGIAPLTGDAASVGIEVQRVIELALEDVNTAWANQGKTLDIQWENSGCNGKDASTVTQKLVNIDKVEVILGGSCSSETLAAAAITEPAGVVLLSMGSSSPDITTAGDYVFRNWPSDAFQGQKLAETANEMGYKKVALITEQQDYTLGISKTFKAKFEELGGAVVEETYLAEDTDFKTQITKLKGEGADAFFVNPQTPIKADNIVKQMKELGVKGPLLLNDVAGTYTDLLTNYADYFEGSYTATPYLDEASESFVSLKTRYNEKYGEPIQYTGYSAAGYDALWIVANTLAEVGNDGDVIQGYLSAFPGYTGLMGETKFDENGDPLSGHSVFIIQGGKMVKK